jgi:hypothetical protein
MIARGIRCRNPGNIRLGQPWLGLVSNPDELDFCTFESAEFGIRALCRLLLTYHRKHGLDTIHSIINRYAPDIENDTSAYQYHVASCMDVGINQCLDLTNPNVMRSLIKAIILHENGSCPYDVEIDKGMVMAGLKLT